VEYILGYAKEKKADAIVSISGSQSNFVTLMAAGARKLGMQSSFVLMKDIHPETQGNLLLHNIMDSDYEIADVPHEAVFGKEMSEKLDQKANDLRRKGYNPFIIRHALPDISVLLSSVGWVDAANEIFQQLERESIDVKCIVLACATGGTYSGLILGSKYLKATYKVLGVSAWMRKNEIEPLIVRRANAVSDFLKLGVNITPGDVEINDEYIGDSYGITTKECVDAIRLVAKTEGIFLDPVYTGKAMAGLIGLIEKGLFTSKDTVVFIHTGGIPPLFAYNKEMIRR
jgi:1-aminocyclopropane-1-carboxylate deaminase/D-cysteine desulfhydrase-like pyridoxal-dependent ACC family enzyme